MYIADPIKIDRSDAIHAAGACNIAAGAYRRQARLRSNAGPKLASHRAWLRQNGRRASGRRDAHPAPH